MTERDSNLYISAHLWEQVYVQPGMEQYMRICSPFLSGKDVRNAINEGRADFIPRHFSRSLAFLKRVSL